METLLIVVTLVALGLAVGMAVLAWRLLRQDRQRAAARAEALLAMASEENGVADVRADVGRPKPAPTYVQEPTHVREIEDTFPEEPEEPEENDAWPSTSAQARPSEVEAWDMRLRSLEPIREAFSRAPDLPRFQASSSPMFGATDEHGAPGRRWIVVAMVAAVMAVVVGTVYALHRPASASSDLATVAPSAAPAATSSARPLELLSLRHSTDPDGGFTVTGLVQNPFDGRVVRRAVAVVYLFDREGSYFASGKAVLDFTALQPGEESPFVVHVPNVGRVSRYRVGFRSEEGGVIAHVDRRGQLPGGTTGDAIEPRPTVPAARRSEG